MFDFRRIVICLAWCAFAAWTVADDRQAKQQTALRISPETTRITEPLDERGFVDYVKAVDDMASRGVRPANNFEVVFRRVLGPEEIPETMRAKYYDRLGIPITKHGLFVNFFDFHKAAGKQPALDRYNLAYQAPWKAEEIPDLARWLTTVDGKLDTIVQGSRREHYYMPYIADDFDDSDDAYPRMISMLLPSIQGHRELARSLRIRANQRIGSGDLDAAWSDTMAVFRMSRLTARGITLIEELVGLAMDRIAFEAAVDVLQSPQLSDKQARQYLTELQSLQPLPSMAEKIDVGERFMGLDAVQTLATQPNLIKTLNLIDALSMIGPPRQSTIESNGSKLVVFQAAAAEPAASSGINWNVTAKLLNGWYDRLVAAAGETDFQKRKTAFKKIESEIETMRKSVSNSPAALLRILGGKQEDEVGEMIGQILVALLMPAINAASQAEYEARARGDVLLLAYAAEVYRRDTGVFPDRLGKLTPAYSQQIPTDAMSGKPLQYKALEQRLILYSVGRNGRDDRGRGYNDDDERDRKGWDDIVVRLTGER